MKYNTLYTPHTQMLKPTFLHNLQPSRSTSSLQTLPKNKQEEPSNSSTQLHRQNFEYEDIVYLKKPLPTSYKITDILARESDVTISNQVTPLTEYRGFAQYLIITAFHLLWLFWTFAPPQVLNKLGIYYYPSRWWSLSLSCTVLMSMLYTYIALQLWNVEVETLKLDDLNTIVDDDAVLEKDLDMYGWCDTNGVYDLRIIDVNKVLYDGYKGS